MVPDRNPQKIVTTKKSYDKSRVSAHNLGQIGGKQAGATEACSQHVARSDSVADSQDGLKCEHLLRPFEHFQQLAHELEDTPHSVYPGFLGLAEGNPTADWIDKVCVPKLYLLMGDDNFLQFHNWQNYQHILQHLRGLLVCPRLGAKSELGTQAGRLRKIKPELEIEFLPRHQWEDLSSREIRSTFLRIDQSADG